MNILTIDPGLDGVGVAVFDVDAWRFQRGQADNVRALWALRKTALIETSPRHALPYRLHLITAELTEAVLFWRPTKIYVERPAIAGTYKRNRRGSNQATLGGMARLYESRGAILAAVTAAMLEIHRHQDDVIDFEACGIPKSNRHRYLAVAEHRIGRILEKRPGARPAGPVTLPRGPRGGIPSDEWDAIWIGLQAFTRLESDLRPPRVAVAP